MDPCQCRNTPHSNSYIRNYWGTLLNVVWPLCSSWRQSASQKKFSDNILRLHSRTTFSDNILGQHSRTTFSDNILGLHSRTTFSDNILGQHSRTTFSDNILGQHSRTTFSDNILRQHSQTCCAEEYMQYKTRVAWCGTTEYPVSLPSICFLEMWFWGNSWQLCRL